MPAEINRTMIPLITNTQTNQFKSNELVETNFSNILKEAIETVNETQNISNEKTNSLIRGDIENLHDVMISAQKASITLEATVQVHRKVIDAYNEIMRMQV